jgi:hypothetical protein
VWNIGSIGISTTAPKTPTNRRGNASGACKASSHPGTLNASSLRMGPLRNTFGRDGIASPRLHTAMRDSKDFKSGARSPAWSWLPEGSIGPQLVRSRPSMASRRDRHEQVDNAIIGF